MKQEQNSQEKEKQRLWERQRQTPPTSTEYEKMPEWDAVKYTNWRNWAKSCYDAGRKNVNQELAKALQDMIRDGHKLFGMWVDIDSNDEEGEKEMFKRFRSMIGHHMEKSEQLLKQAGLTE